ncbi:MAG: hypothetical protein EHM18_09185, partial [Acidobacteria bacterium]
MSIPKGGGAIQGMGETFQPNPYTGTGHFSIPIFTSRARNDFHPKLRLQYSTGSGNSPFGFGWQLSLPRVSRKTEKGLPSYTDEDTFIISGAEDLVPVFRKVVVNNQIAWERDRFTSADGQHTITRYRPRTEGTFARIEKWERIGGNQERIGEIHWRSITKENITSVYGPSPSSRIVDPETAQQPATQHRVY